MDQAAYVEAVARVKADAGAFLPEIILSFVVCALLLYDVCAKKATHRGAALLAAFGVVGAGVALFVQAAGLPPGGRELFAVVKGDGPGMLRADGFGVFFKALILLGTLIAVPMSLQYKDFQNRKMGEYYALLLGAAIGMFIMSAATNLLMFYLGVEFASLASYLLVSFVKRDMKGGEAGLKYVVYGSVASGVMIYGISLIYGMTGSLHLGALAETFRSSGTSNAALLLAGVLCFAGFAYKMAAFPMHFWCPDVYEGAPTPVAAFLSVTSKAAGFALFVRFLLAFNPGFVVALGDGVRTIDWPTAIAIVSAASMTVGNLSALAQTNVKRMLAYSSIAHAGYLLMAVAALRPGPAADGRTDGLLYYFVVYLFMNLGAFYVVNAAESDARLKARTVDDYAGLGRRAPWIGACLTIFLFSLIGLPPTAGFTGKLQLLMNVIDRKMIWLAVVAGVNTAISTYYYAKLLKAMYFSESKESEPFDFGMGTKVVVGLLAAPVLWLFLDADPVVGFAARLGL